MESRATDPAPADPARSTRKVEEKIVQKTTGEDPPPEESTHWTSRLMGKALGIDHVTIWRVWRKYGLKPHQIRRFKLSRDPRLVEKLHDVVGVYMNPPDNAVVFSFDEKSQIQALDRTQPGLPLKKGRAGTMTHDYKRHGTTTLFAALNVATGHVIHACMPRHRHQEFLRFIKDRRTQRRSRSRDPRHPRQLRHAQARKSPELVGQKSQGPLPLRPHRGLLGQYRGTPLR